MILIKVYRMIQIKLSENVLSHDENVKPISTYFKFNNLPSKVTTKTLVTFIMSRIHLQIFLLTKDNNGY